MGAKIYHYVGKKGFWIDQKYVRRLVAFKEWPTPDTEPEVVAAADSLHELERKLADDFWEKDERGARTSFSLPICRISPKKAPG